MPRDGGSDADAKRCADRLARRRSLRHRRLADRRIRPDDGDDEDGATYLAAEAAFEAAGAGVQTHGGFDVAREYDVERYYRETRLPRLIQVIQQLALNSLGERVLGLPRSY